MSKTIQVRGVADHVYSALQARAARAGLSLSGFLRRELARLAEMPLMTEWLARTESAKPGRPGRSSGQLIRELRDSR